jgi:preprotein translocase subunit SecG
MIVGAFVIGVVCCLLVVVILAQNSKGGGLAMGGNATQMIGTRRATDGIEKATWVLFAVLVALALGMNAYISSQSATEEPVNVETPAPAETPAEGEGQQQGQ